MRRYLQHAISVEALQYLEGETDAKGRRLEVIKMPCPPPLHITEEESNGVAHVEGSKPRKVCGQATTMPVLLQCRGEKPRSLGVTTLTSGHRVTPRDHDSRWTLPYAVQWAWP